MYDVLLCYNEVVRYWAEKGKSGFLVWRYLVCRDDRLPALIVSDDLLVGKVMMLHCVV